MTSRLPQAVRSAGAAAMFSALSFIATSASPSQAPAALIGPVTPTADCPVLSISLIGQVAKVFGPRLFTVAVPGVQAETMVSVPGSRVAAVHTGLPVCILGVSAATATAHFGHNWGSFEGRETAAHAYQSMLVATQATSRRSDVIVSAAEHATFAVDGSAAARVVTDLETLANSNDTSLVGRYVSLLNVQITVVGSRPGFWIGSASEELFVLPADEVHPEPGQRVNLKGVVLQLPQGMTNMLADFRAARDEVIYVYASQFRTLSRRVEPVLQKDQHRP